MTSSKPRTSSRALERRDPGAIAAAWLRAKRSPQTRRAYRSDLVSVGRAILADDQADDQAAILAAARADLAALVTWREQAIASEAPATVARRLAAVRTFHRFLRANEYRHDNPAADLEAPIVSQDEQKRPSMEASDVRAILAAATSGPVAALHTRNRAIVLLLASIGLRIAEALGLRARDFDQAAKSIHVRSATAKRGEARDLGISDQLAADLAHLARDLEPGERLIPITRERVRQLCQAWAAAAGLPEAQITPHAFRRTFATLAIDRGVPIETLRRTMGHRDPRTTARYDRRRQASAIVEY